MGFLDDAMRNLDGRSKPPDEYQKPVDINSFINDAAKAQGSTSVPSQPMLPDNSGLSSNPLRPETFDDYIGQDYEKARLKKIINGCLRTGKAMHHVMITGPSGTGKTTLAHIIANELGKKITVMEAPIHKQNLIEEVMEMEDGDILLIDEIHLMAKGKQAGNDPAVLYHVMEDRKIDTEQGRFDVPEITVIGCTTDEGMLPEAFLNRFTLKPRLVDYTDDDMQEIVVLNAKQLEIGVDPRANGVFAKASLGIPRRVNQFVKIGQALMDAYHEPQVSERIAKEVLRDEGIEADGLNHIMMKYLTELFRRRKWSEAKKEWVITASLQTMAHAIDRGQDVKFVQHRVEPTLIKRNYIGIGSRGREITLEGIERIGEKMPDPPLKDKAARHRKGQS